MKTKASSRFLCLALGAALTAALAGCSASGGSLSRRSPGPLERQARVAGIADTATMADYNGLVETLRKDSDRLVRSEAAFALGHLSTVHFGVAFHPLVDSLENDPSVFVRAASALSLSTVRDSRAIQPLVGALEDTARGELAVRHGDRVIVYRACTCDAARYSLEKVVGISFASDAATAPAKRIDVASQWDKWYTPRRSVLPDATAYAKE